MKKCVFLGIDFTPRKMMYAKIDELERDVALYKAEIKNLLDKIDEHKEKGKSLLKSIDAISTMVEIYKAKVIDLAEGEPSRDKKGQFTKIDCKKCEHSNICPFDKKKVKREYCFLSKV